MNAKERFRLAYRAIRIYNRGQPLRRGAIQAAADAAGMNYGQAAERDRTGLPRRWESIEERQHAQVWGRISAGRLP